jgi:hypothetical protein
VTDHIAKEEIVSNHFQSIMGTKVACTHDFNWDEFNFTSKELHSLGDPFSEEEVKCAIDQMPSDKAPARTASPGFFFKKCWGIIKGDLMRAIHHFVDLHVENFHWLNSANIALLPKREVRRRWPTSGPLR